MIKLFIIKIKLNKYIFWILILLKKIYNLLRYFMKFYFFTILSFILAIYCINGFLLCYHTCKTCDGSSYDECTSCNLGYHLC